ncbi:MAG: hypothetical protein Q7T86_02950 [Hyphomicrobiaceae bacterium]|nr:hypothetical protein [Hyphomicrobiaceae bacterium]
MKSTTRESNCDGPLHPSAPKAGAYPTRHAPGTGIVHTIPLTFVAAGPCRLSNVDPMILVGLLAGSIPGFAIGSRITGIIPDWVPRVALSLVLCYAV